jgi:hypothetical protein
MQRWVVLGLFRSPGGGKGFWWYGRGVGRRMRQYGEGSPWKERGGVPYPSISGSQGMKPRGLPRR